ncbi:RHS repeat domain-containing protein [Pseudacidovorax intermedius]|uniref:RHS repeat domain-containing protein n=1 Tax=Pseudacidovorax intermedius TaxID=433924 RepID=UPI0005C28766|nr:RHS repeat domain-containing protein [Pseudacidovorax intermedius]
MVAIVSGSSLGLSLGSLRTLGQQGVLGSAEQGRSGEQAYVNVATGNLVLQSRDEFVAGRGLDVGSLRTYNSRGLWNDDNQDNWLVGAFGQRALVDGQPGQAGSSVTRTDRDGAEAVYAWDVNRGVYISSAGAGAYDTIAYNAQSSQLVWVDGDSGATERYQASPPGRLISASDADGNLVTLSYDSAGHVQSVTDANGEVTCYDYVGDNLVQIRTITSANVTSTRLHYGYDNSNRLVMVTVDLSPEDNSVADGNTYVTRYTYDGASTRVATLAQTDGTSLSLTYVQIDGEYKVSSVMRQLAKSRPRPGAACRSE